MKLEMETAGQTNSDTSIECTEIRVPVPWGFIAGKWWGSREMRPIVAVHGWQDNAGSFDKLIPLLPSYISVLAIDLPGHGYSPKIPDGMAFHSLDMIHMLNSLINYFQWEKISLMAHSMGSISSFVFAGMFPTKVDMVIALDALKPHITESDSALTLMSSRMNVATMSDETTHEIDEEPSYSYEELVAKLHLGTFGSITKNSCLYLLARNTTMSKKYPGKFNLLNKFSSKNFGKESFTQELNIKLACNIQTPYLFIKSSRSPYYEDKKYFDEILEVMNQNVNFESHQVEGTHHVHLNDPTKVSGIITDFIEKYRPVIPYYIEDALNNFHF